MATAPKTPVPGNTVPPRTVVPDEGRKHARMVKARTRVYYGQMREEGDVFENTLDLATYPEDKSSNIEAVED
jgi:hypothetical protein